MNFEEILKEYKYCFICGGNLTKKGFNFLQCDSCGHRDYINPRPTSGAILENDRGEILLVERKVEPGKGLWDLPGGFIDIGENAEEGMSREINEELGVDISDLTYFKSYPNIYLFDGVVEPILDLVYIGEIGNQEITVSDDVAGFKFFKKSELPFERLAFESLRKALKDYINDRR